MEEPWLIDISGTISTKKMYEIENPYYLQIPRTIALTLRISYEG